MRMSDDDLERAILAQRLEVPPADLRASILAATVYRPAPVFSLPEIVAGAGILAAFVWLVVTTGPQIGMAFISAGTNATLLLWLAAGVAVTIWFELLMGSQPGRAFARRAKGRAGP